MNKQLIIGLIAGVAIATTGGVAAYQFLGRSVEPQQGSTAVDTPAQPAIARDAAPAKAPVHRDAIPRTEVETAPAPQPAAPATASTNCDRQASAPKDDKQIAGTAAGAAIGGIVGHNLGNHKLTTAITAAVGAYFGNKFEKKYQDNKAQQSAGASGCPPN